MEYVEMVTPGQAKAKSTKMAKPKSAKPKSAKPKSAKPKSAKPKSAKPKDKMSKPPTPKPPTPKPPTPPPSILSSSNVSTTFKGIDGLIMYYHSALRNISTLNALAFAALVYSRHYRGKNKLYDLGLTSISLLMLVSSCLLNVFLLNSISKHGKQEKFKKINKLRNINIIFVFVHLLLIPLGVYTIIRIIQNKKII